MRRPAPWPSTWGGRSPRLAPVQNVRIHRQRLALLAWLAALALALLPTLSRAWAGPAGAGGWAEVCTSLGPRLVALDADEGQAPPSLEHCPLCPLGALAAPPPAFAPHLPVLAASGQAPQARPAAAPRARQPWRAAQPRAPPRQG